MISHKDVIDGYVRWAHQLIADGFEMTQLTFMFNQLDPTLGSSLEQQQREIERIYGMLLTRMFRQPNHPRHFLDLPRWIVAPDWPVHKRDKDHLRDIMLNNGLHHHAGGFTRDTGRMKRPLADIVDEEQRLFSGPDKLLSRLHAEPVTHNPEYVIRYLLKSLERGRISAGDVFVLPRATTELNGPRPRLEMIPQPGVPRA